MRPIFAFATRVGLEEREGDPTSLRRERFARARAGTSIHASRPFREMTARPNIGRNERTWAERGAFRRRECRSLVPRRRRPARGLLRALGEDDAVDELRVVDGAADLLDDLDAVEVDGRGGRGVDDSEHGVDGERRERVRVLRDDLGREARRDGVDLRRERPVDGPRPAKRRASRARSRRRRLGRRSDGSRPLRRVLFER